MFFLRFSLSILLLTGASLVAADVTYSVAFLGVDGSLRESLESSSSLVNLRDKPPSTLAALRRRANNDLSTLRRALQNEGYYDVSIETRLERQGSGYRVELDITKGPRYKFEDPLITVPCEEDYCAEVLTSIHALDLGKVGLSTGDPALANAVIEGRGHLMYRLGEEGFPLPEIVEEKVLVNRRSKTVRVVYIIDTGPRATMGCVTIIGLEKVLDCFVHDHIHWCEEDYFHPLPLAQLELDLQNSTLFSYARVSTGDAIAEDGSIPILIKVLEAKHRSIGAGISYASQQGPGVSAEWEHRNLWGSGERLSLHGHLWSRLQRGLIVYRIPNFLACNQALVWLLEYEREDTEGYREKSATASVLLEKKITTCQSMSYGIAIKQLESDQSDTVGTYTLFRIPLYYSWDNSNDLLDPTNGSKFLVRIVPTQDLGDASLQYAMMMGTAILYYPFDDACRYVVASKVVVGSLVGADRIDIPAPERFYTGNEHTLRGYSYMTVSPLGPAGNLIGGRSLFAASFEWRHRWNDDWGWVAFYDVGNTYVDPMPQVNHKQLQSVGLGLRYFTSVGPLRLDFAAPLNRRATFDSTVQVYFSIGQAF